MPGQDLHEYHRKITDERFDKIDKKLDRLTRFMWVMIGIAIATSAWGGRVLDMAAAVAGGKMKNSNSQNMAALSAAVDQAGATIDASQVVAASAQVVVTGTSTGNLKFQFSNDVPAQCTVDAKGKLQPSNWSDIASQTVAVAGAGVVVIPKFDCCYQFIRTFFAHTNAAAGTITVEVNTKGF